jgi:hypothetical protein
MLPPGLLKLYKGSPPTENNAYNNFYGNNTNDNKFSPWDKEVVAIPNNRKNYVEKNLGYATNPQSVITISEFTKAADIIINKEELLKTIKDALYKNLRLHFSDQIRADVFLYIVPVILTGVLGILTAGGAVVGTAGAIVVFLNILFSEYNLTGSQWQKPIVNLINNFLLNNQDPNIEPLIDLLIMMADNAMPWDELNMQGLLKLLESMV